MMWQMRAVIFAVTILAGALIAAPASRAEEGTKGPAFDCTKASSEVEKLICADEELAALDRKLDEVYKTALAKARDGMDKTLRAEQRGWIKGRDECWKAQGKENPLFLTASWTATSVRECVEAQYKLRISELQVQWQLAPEKKPIFFACESNPANEVVATFFETDPPAVRLERGDKTVIAWQVPGGGGKYEGQNVSFSSKGNEATVTWLGEELKCQAP